MSDRDGLNRERARQFAWRLLQPAEALSLLDQDQEREQAKRRAEASDGGEGSGEGSSGSGGKDEPPAPGLAMAAEAAEPYGVLPGVPGDRIEPEDPARSAQLLCSQLATAAESAWVIADDAAQRRATTRLARQAAALSLSLTAMHRHPRASVRLARLFVRHHARLSSAAQAAADRALLWLPLEHDEVEDLLVEIAVAGNRGYAALLRMAMPREDWGVSAFRPDFPLRLARVLDDGPTWQARLCALDWLDYAPSRAAVPAVRRALRLPHLGLRDRALDFLLEQNDTQRSAPPASRAQPALTPDDVLVLLSDLIAHPPPLDATGTFADAIERFAGRLDAALGSLRPPAGAALLRRMFDEGERFWQDPFYAFNRGWALKVLATAYPELPETLTTIDDMLDSCLSHERLTAVEAASRLPEAAAKERLLRGAADGSPQIAESARDLWLQRWGGLCPVDELAGVPLELLAGPPSERLRARLLVLRGMSEEARYAILEVLLGEAPDPEALALLVFALGDDGLWRRRGRPRLPTGSLGYAVRLVSKFGRQGIRGLIWLIDRYPSEKSDVWLQALIFLLTRQNHPARRSDLPLVQALALRRLSLPTPPARCEALRLLSAVAPRLHPDLALRDRVWAWSQSREPESAAALALLFQWPADPQLDDRILAQLTPALEAGDYARFSQLFGLARHRKLPGLLERAEGLVAAWQPRAPGSGWRHDGAAHAAVGRCYELLGAEGRLPPGWQRAALARPDDPEFMIALERLTWDGPPQELRRLLRPALSSTARGGESAVAAALALFFDRATRTPRAPLPKEPASPQSPQSLENKRAARPRLPLTGKELRALLERVERRHGVRLLNVLIVLKGVLPISRATLIEYLADPAPEVAGPMSHCIWALCDLVGRPFLESVLPSVQSAEVREVIEDAVRIEERRNDGFWQDSDADEA